MQPRSAALSPDLHRDCRMSYFSEPCNGHGFASPHTTMRIDTVSLKHCVNDGSPLSLKVMLGAPDIVNGAAALIIPEQSLQHQE